MKWNIDYKVIYNNEKVITYRFIYTNAKEKKNFLVSYNRKEECYYLVVIGDISKIGVEQSLIKLGSLTLTEVVNELCFK